MSEERLELLNCGQELLISAAEDTIEKEFGLKTATGWNVFGAPPFELTLKKVLRSPNDVLWYTYLIIKKDDRTVIGFGGYAGPPDEERTVKIGYAIAKSQRRKGYATEAAQLLINKAKKSGLVSVVQAITTPLESPSNYVLKKLGFDFAKELHSEEDGDAWLWEKVV